MDDFTPRCRCYECMRPTVSCICKQLAPIDTKTHFVILMHPMEHKKEKNGTGRMTHLQLKNSEFIVDIDFTKNKRVNTLLADLNHDCYLLYPGVESLNISKPKKEEITELKKPICLFILDATWPLAKKMLRLSHNLHSLKRMSFDPSYKSQFILKQQPHELCLSTIESTLVVLNSLNKIGIESVSTESFLAPFKRMIEFEVECIKNPPNNSYRKKSGVAIKEKVFYKKNPSRNLFFNQ